MMIQKSLIYKRTVQFSSVQSLSRVLLFATPWTAAHQASLSITKSRSLLKLMSTESVMPPTISSSVVPFSSCLQSFPASRVFLMSQFFTSGGQNISISASASVLPKKSQGWSPSEWTGWIIKCLPHKAEFPKCYFPYHCMPSSCHQVVIQIFVSRINTCPKSSRLTVAAKGLLLKWHKWLAELLREHPLTRSILLGSLFGFNLKIFPSTGIVS